MTDPNPAKDILKKDQSFQNEMFPEVASDPNYSDQKQTDQTEGNADQKMAKIVPKGEGAKRRYKGIKTAKSQKAKEAPQPHKTKADNMVKWSVFVQEETKTACGKAIDKAGISVAEWTDTRLRKIANDELSKRPQPPAKVEDVADIIKQFTDQIQANQQAAQEAQANAMNAQNDLIRQQGEQLAVLSQTIEKGQSKSLRDMIFGRKKEN